MNFRKLQCNQSECSRYHFFKYKYNPYLLQLMEVGVNGLTGTAVVFPVDLVRRQDRDSAQIPDLIMVGIIVQEPTKSIKHVKLAAAQVIITTFIIYVKYACFDTLVVKRPTLLWTCVANAYV